MQSTTLRISSRKLARLTGIFYLLIILGGLYGGLAVRGTIIDPANTETTLHNIIAKESLFRIGFLSDFIMVLSDVMVSVLFYFLLVHVNKVVALFAAVFRLMQSAVLGANLINLYTPLVLIQGHEGMDPQQYSLLGYQVMTTLQIFDYGYLVSGVFFSVNCFLMGYLLYKSPLFPRVLGVMIALAAIGYLFNCTASFFIPSLVEISQILLLFTAIISELALCGWLLIKGISEDKMIHV
jgi:hypothetical protein